MVIVCHADFIDLFIQVHFGHCHLLTTCVTTDDSSMHSSIYAFKQSLFLISVLFRTTSLLPVNRTMLAIYVVICSIVLFPV
jgi:hypothetical protein